MEAQIIFKETTCTHEMDYETPYVNENVHLCGMASFTEKNEQIHFDLYFVYAHVSGKHDLWKTERESNGKSKRWHSRK